MEDVEGDWVVVLYEEEQFLGKVVGKAGKFAHVRCLEKPYTIKEPQFLEREGAIWYNTIFKPDCIPQNVKVGQKLMWKY